MEHRYTVGEVQKRTGIPTSALRFYDDIGLVKPSYTDENTGYRYYGYTEFWQLEIVKICKSMGISLKELKKVLESNDPSRFVDLMMRQRDTAREKLAAMQKMVDDLNWMTERYEAIEAYRPGTYEIKNIKERCILSVNADSKLDSDSLHFALQCKAEDALSSRMSIKREYGYEFDPDAFSQKQIRWLKEFLVVEDGEYRHDRFVEKLPAGDYICFMCKPFSESGEWTELLTKLKEASSGRKMGRVIAMEAALYFYDWRDEVYEIQIQLI